MNHYTKGEWKAYHKGSGGYYVSNGRKVIADIEDFGEDESQTNAHLIAAAPVMYDILKVIKKYLDRPHCDAWRIAVDGKGEISLGDIIDKALAKAEREG